MRPLRSLPCGIELGPHSCPISKPDLTHLADVLPPHPLPTPVNEEIKFKIAERDGERCSKPMGRVRALCTPREFQAQSNLAGNPCGCACVSPLQKARILSPNPEPNASELVELLGKGELLHSRGCRDHLCRRWLPPLIGREPKRGQLVRRARIARPQGVATDHLREIGPRGVMEYHFHLHDFPEKFGVPECWRTQMYTGGTLP
jgi:hypothetical protein